MAYQPILRGNKKRYAIITPDPHGECSSLIVPIEYLSEVLDTYTEDDGKGYRVEVVDRTDRWLKKFPEHGNSI